MAMTWVLGAGFSRPLGGPLLANLLSGSMAPLLRACFPATSHPRLHDVIVDDLRVLFREGHGAQRWSDAEEFLDILDSATAAASPRRTELESLARRGGRSPSASELREAAKRPIAAECSAFLLGADPSSEKWQPYRRWAGLLTAPDDTIVSFNYDTVPDLLASAGGTALKVKLPGMPMSVRDVPLLKLHGSTSWKRVAPPDHSPRFTQGQSDYHAIECPIDESAIASPGPTKRSVTAELGLLWDEAHNALRGADVIVFVGYRFPPTDAYSRERLLDAITRNERPHVALHVVLGPRPDEHVVRLQAMLVWALRLGGRRELRQGESLSSTLDKTYRLNVQPLWAEDFFSVFQPAHLRTLPTFPPK